VIQSDTALPADGGMERANEPGTRRFEHPIDLVTEVWWWRGLSGCFHTG